MLCGIFEKEEQQVSSGMPSLFNLENFKLKCSVLTNETEMPLRYRLQMGECGRSVNHKKILDEIWPCGDKTIRFGHNTIKQDCVILKAVDTVAKSSFCYHHQSLKLFET